MADDEYSTSSIMERLRFTLARYEDTSDPYAERAPATQTSGPSRAVGGRVVFMPAPEGQIKIVGLDENDGWLCEFACLEVDYRDEYYRRMQRHVAAKTGARLAIVR